MNLDSSVQQPALATTNSSFLGGSAYGGSKLPSTALHSSGTKNKTDGWRDTADALGHDGLATRHVVPRDKKPAGLDLLVSLDSLERKYQEKTNTLTQELQKATTAHARDIELWQLERTRHQEACRVLEEQLVSLRNQMELTRLEHTAAVDKLKKQLKSKQEQFDTAFVALENKAKECILVEQKCYEAKVQQLEERYQLKLEKATFELSSSVCLQLESSRKETEGVRKEKEGVLKEKMVLEERIRSLEAELRVYRSRTYREFGVQADLLPQVPPPPKMKDFGCGKVDESVAVSKEIIKNQEIKVTELAEVIKDKEEVILHQKRELISLRDQFKQYIKQEMTIKRNLISVVDQD